MAVDEQGKWAPADPERCQCERPNGANFMTLGAAPALVRCRNQPIVIATEREIPKGADRLGEMSLCAHCMNKFLEQLGHDYATFEAIEREGDDLGV